jgi:dTDP-glucose 4,6-dehydratase
MKNILITGGAGFIGSHVVNYFANKYPKYRIYVVDSLTYASNLTNIMMVKDNGDIEWAKNVTFFKLDIRDTITLNKMFKTCRITDVIHLAAESHVDNSIKNPNIFVETNVNGTVNLLNCAKEYWGDVKEHRFHHVSTDEVYGDLSLSDAPFIETTPYAPSSPYSASKASSDHFVRAYGRTYGLNTTISNCSNNYGPHQHAEKLIPVVINKLKRGEKIPVYGKGENIRDWLWVGDHVKAIDEIFHNGKSGHTYNVGGDQELTNLELIKRICVLYAKYMNGGKYTDQVDIPIKYVTDRKGHDLRYSINSNKLKIQLNWKPEKDLLEGLKETIEYYIDKAHE